MGMICLAIATDEPRPPPIDCAVLDVILHQIRRKLHSQKDFERLVSRILVTSGPVSGNCVRHLLE